MEHTSVGQELRLPTVFCYKTNLHIFRNIQYKLIQYQKNKTVTCVVIYEHCNLT